MPAALASKLQRSSAKRLIILPVSDIGFVPFAALPFDGEQLIDRFALVLLPDVEALLGLSLDVRALRDREMRSIVVRDPDLSQDQRWNFPPLPGARNEAMEVAALLGVEPLIGEEATKRHLLDQLPAGTPASSILRRMRYPTPSIPWMAAFWRLPAITSTDATSKACCSRTTRAWG